MLLSLKTNPQGRLARSSVICWRDGQEAAGLSGQQTGE